MLARRFWLCGVLLATGLPAPGAAFDADAVIARVRALPARELAPELPATPLGEWLRATAAPARVEWETNDCGEQSGDGRVPQVVPICAEAGWRTARDVRVGFVVMLGPEAAGEPTLFSLYLLDSERVRLFRDVSAWRAAMAAAP
ncbi:MAG: hypothetical protein MJE66_03520 [Proteobacteria bacterium]|nr:hypothetical protein [Pseudomonadota bacterium]